MNSEEIRVATAVVSAFYRHAGAPTLEQQQMTYQKLSGAIDGLAQLTRQAVADTHAGPEAVLEATIEYYLEVYSPVSGGWSSGCGWDSDNLEGAMGLLEGHQEWRRRLLREDYTVTLLGEREATEVPPVCSPAKQVD